MPGLYIECGGSYTNLKAINNSYGYSGQYSGVVTNRQGIDISNSRVDQPGTYLLKYGFDDTLSPYTAEQSKNTFANCNRGAGVPVMYGIASPATGRYLPALGAAPADVVLTVGQNTIDVTHIGFLLINSPTSGAGLISFLTGGVPNQTITIYTPQTMNAGTASFDNSWYVSVGGIRPPPSPTLSAFSTYRLTYNGSEWLA